MERAIAWLKFVMSLKCGKYYKGIVKKNACIRINHEKANLPQEAQTTGTKTQEISTTKYKDIIYFE